ncbi:MAG: LysR family transcriptional regulator [Oscillospiraceae bacterium]|nr:LysR family transcriptional regulator [Oscillospiraceae bacterium]
MNTSQLECFVSLAGTLNFVRTADQLNLTQPAVSRQIQALEAELGTRLFHRTSRSVSLTPVGEQFLSEANDMLNIYYRSINWIRSYSTEGRNPLRIGYSDPLVMQIISILLKTYLERWPESLITPEFICDQTDANLGRLQKGQLDCVISMRDAHFDDSEIIFSVLQTCGFLCGIAKTHPLASDYLADPALPRRVSTEQIWPYRQIIAIPPYLLKKYFSRGRSLLPVNDQVDNIICSNINEAYALILSGIGYAMLPEYLNVDHPDVLYLRWTESAQAPFGIYYRKPEDKATPIWRFLQVSREYYAERF